MDSPTQQRFANTEDKAQLKQRIINDADNLGEYFFPLHYPIKLLGDIMAAIFKFVSPYTPNLIPLAVFLLSLPVIALLSISAGWFVWRSAAVAWELELPLQYGDGMSPYAEIPLSTIITYQPYDVSLHLLVPATEPNYALGNFMTSLMITTPANRTLAYIRKPSMVPPRSSAPWSFLYNWPGTVDLTVHLLSGFALDTSRAIARVEVGRQDQWKGIGNGEGRELSVLSAVLRGTVVHQGVRGLVARFPIISAIAAACAFLFIGFVVLASCLLPALELRFNSDPHINDPPPRIRRRPRQRPNPNATTSDEQRTQRSNMRRSKSRSVTEPDSVTTPTSEPQTEQEPRVKQELEIELDPLDPELNLQQGPLTGEDYQAHMEELLRRAQEGTEYDDTERSIAMTPGSGSIDIWDSTPFLPLRRRRSRASAPDLARDGD